MLVTLCLCSPIPFSYKLSLLVIFLEKKVKEQKKTLKLRKAKKKLDVILRSFLVLEFKDCSEFYLKQYVAASEPFLVF